jgi:DNA-binding NarL/FixJ family response regulator
MAGRHEPTTEARHLVAAPEPPARARDIGVFLCDDAPALRQLLRAYLELDGGFAIVGESEDGDRLVERVRAAAADVVVLDLSMPRVDGLEALVDLRAAEPDLGIVVLSGFDRSAMATRTLTLGADRYLEKSAGMEHVRAAVRAVAAERAAS